MDADALTVLAIFAFVVAAWLAVVCWLVTRPHLPDQFWRHLK